METSGHNALSSELQQSQPKKIMVQNQAVQIETQQFDNFGQQFSHSKADFLEHNQNQPKLEAQTLEQTSTFLPSKPPKDHHSLKQNEKQLRHEYRSYKNAALERLSQEDAPINGHQNKSTIKFPQNLLKFDFDADAQPNLPKFRGSQAVSTIDHLAFNHNSTITHAAQGHPISSYPQSVQHGIRGNDQMPNRSTFLRSSQGGRWRQSRRSYQESTDQQNSTINNISSMQQRYQNHQTRAPQQQMHQSIMEQSRFDQNFIAQKSHFRNQTVSRGYSYAQSVINPLIKNYHKHESRLFATFEHAVDLLFWAVNLSTSKNTPLRIPINEGNKTESFLVYFSLIEHSLEQIKQKIEGTLSEWIHLENMPIDKPNHDWTQSELTKFFTNYHPIFLPEHKLESKQQLQTLKKYKNCVYFGQIVKGKKHGHGVIYYYSGRIFEGYFEHDQKKYGLEIDQNFDEVYLGFFKGQKHGTGMMKNNTSFYYGIWTENEFKVESDYGPADLNQTQSRQFGTTMQSLHQSKVLKNNTLHTNKAVRRQGITLNSTALIIQRSSSKTKNNSNSHFSSSLRASSKEPEYADFKVLKDTSGSIYIGCCTNPDNDTLNNESKLTSFSPQKYGVGMEIFQNGDLYIGNYQNNVPQDYGEYYWGSGAYYRGNFMSGMRHGKGKWHLLHGDSYEGEYMNDKKNGKGTYLWKNGAKYQGEFENDYRHGYGEMRWQDGREYKGEWVNGIEKNVTIKLQKIENSQTAESLQKQTHNQQRQKESNINSRSASYSASQGHNGLRENNRYRDPSKKPNQNLPSLKASINSFKQGEDLRKQYHLNQYLSKQKQKSSSFSGAPNSSARGRGRSTYALQFQHRPVSKKIAISNIKALYNPSNY